MKYKLDLNSTKLSSTRNSYDQHPSKVVSMQYKYVVYWELYSIYVHDSCYYASDSASTKPCQNHVIILTVLINCIKLPNKS